MKPTRLTSCIALGLALAAPIPAMALVGGAGPDPNTASSPWNGVGSLHVGNSFFTATMIAPGYLLTAAHVVNGANAADVSFQLNTGSLNSPITASKIIINPGYISDYNASIASNDANSDLTVHNDLAIIRLTSAPGAADIPSYNLYSGNLKDAELNFVSFANSSTVKEIGANIADVLYTNANTNAPGTNQTYMFDFDSASSLNMMGSATPLSNEASFEGGDSGSAAFVSVNGQWQLAGINTEAVTWKSSSNSNVVIATGGAGVAVSGYSNWISSVLATPVPEPESSGMLVLGLASLLGVTKRRSRGLVKDQKTGKTPGMISAD